FCRDKKAVLMLEEGQPNYIEQNVATILRQRGVDALLEGKGVLPVAGEYTTAVMRDGLPAFLRQHHPESLPALEAPAETPTPGLSVVAPATEATATATATATMPEVEADGDLAIEEDHPVDGGAANGDVLGAAPTAIPRVQPMQVNQVARKPSVQPINFQRQVSELAQVVPPRPAGFCTGCPERPVFSALSLAQEKLGEHHIACDIGCHLFSILPPFNLGATTMGYGLGASSA